MSTLVKQSLTEAPPEKDTLLAMVKNQVIVCLRQLRARWNDFSPTRDMLSSGDGSPEAVVTGNKGFFYLDSTNGEAYIFQGVNGENTGWKLVTHA